MSRKSQAEKKKKKKKKKKMQKSQIEARTAERVEASFCVGQS
jgi:hypothetical protein